MTLPACSCGAPAGVFSPGADAERAEIGILLAPSVPDRAWCMACAREAGWPWLAGERPRAARAPGRKPYRRKGELFAPGERLAAP